MLARIREFSQLLRKGGVRVSTAETLDAARAAEAVGVREPGAFREALAATLVKRPSDRAVFDELYALHFFGRRGGLGAHASALLGALRAEMPEDAARAAAAELAGRAAELSPAARQALGFADRPMPELVRQAGLATELERMTSPLQIGFYSQRMLEALEVTGAEAALAAAAEGMGGVGALTEAQAATVAGLVRDRFAALRRDVRGYVEDEYRRQNPGRGRDRRANALADTPLTRLSEADVAALRGEIDRFARALRARVARPRRSRRRGRLDVERTLRRSLAAGGVPLWLGYRRRRPHRPRLVVLCDISDSVRNVSRFMLTFAYALQERFDRVRAFAFVSELGELTPLFRDHDIDRAIERAYRGDVVSVMSNSNYGRVLREFADRHLGALSPRTTVLVIGDARNNHYPSEARALALIRSRCDQLLWLNPESPALWGFGDSAMHEYQEHCDRVVVARDFDSLRQVVTELVR